MTAATLPKIPSNQVITSSVAIYIWYCCSLVTFGFVGVAIIIAGLWVAYRPLGYPWFMFNRNTSATWLNRSILIVRGGAAILSSNLQSSIVASNLFFHEIPFSNFVTCLFAGEASWITYVFHEALHPLTRESTALSSLLSPVEATYMIDCSFFSENMDVMVFSNSTIINIIAVARTNKVSFLDAKEAIPSLLLTSSAMTYLDLSSTFGSLKRPMDVISATMTGILSLDILGLKFHFGTKLWILLYSREVKDDGTILLLPNAFERNENIFQGPFPIHHPKTRLDSIKVHAQHLIFSAIIYVLISLVGNVTYSAFARSFISNDFGWAECTLFLQIKLNIQLMASTNQSINLTDASLVDITQPYNESNSQFFWSTGALNDNIMIHLHLPKKS
ncbi:hypothetical protein THRCLA_20615 [Thraustotheca clavata]|uniref:Transmembrane protein n=1 Tax=Thraustotheca clavata TaxID=74557 RepID=A0A1W0A580_9STRA|nr:hypothetical protein THRCLA_20615 [Thraustotheca clavata]